MTEKNPEYNDTIAKEIYEYMVEKLAEGVYIEKEAEEEMIEEIKNIIGYEENEDE